MMRIIAFFLLVFHTVNSFELENSNEQLFEEFIIQYKKHYTTEDEREMRFSIFQTNVERMRDLNKQRKNPTDAYFNINEFSDLKEEELPFVHSDRVDVPLAIQQNESLPYGSQRDKSWNRIPFLPEGDDLPENYAFCGEYVNKNRERPQIDFCGKAVSQGRCSCCWATSLVNLAQYIYSNLTYERYGCIKTPPIFSIQRFLDVTQTKASKRCCKGNPKDAMDAVPSFSLDNDYPFIDSNNGGQCTVRGDQNPNVQIQMVITGYKTFGIRPEDNMVLVLKKLLHHYGPFLVSLKASGTNFNSYSSGIFEFPAGKVCDTSSSSFMTDHEVVLMGWGKENGIEYFIIRNSWASGWGEGDNYMRIKTTNLCGIGWRIGDNVYPLNMLVYATTCKFDQHCTQCDLTTQLCSQCESGYFLNGYKKCQKQTLHSYSSRSRSHSHSH